MWQRSQETTNQLVSGDFDRIVRGVRVYTTTGTEGDPGRILLSDGNELVVGSHAGAVYSPSARVPRAPWRPPSEFERVLLTGGGAPFDTVAVTRLFDGHTLERVRPSLKSLWLMPRNDARVWTHPLTKLITSRIAQLCRIDEELAFHGVTFDPPGFETLSLDKRSGTLVGLHVDYWDAKPLTDRRRSAIRISVNLGPQDRYFLFVNITIQEMVPLVGLSLDEDTLEAAHVARQFLKKFPRYPVVRVRIAPGEAYVAPTENILHDASSISATVPVHHTAFRGRFWFREPITECAKATGD